MRARIVSMYSAVRLPGRIDRKSTRLNSSHLGISYAVFCLKKKKKSRQIPPNHETNQKLNHQRTGTDHNTHTVRTALLTTHNATTHQNHHNDSQQCTAHQCQ